MKEVRQVMTLLLMLWCRSTVVVTTLLLPMVAVVPWLQQCRPTTTMIRGVERKLWEEEKIGGRGDSGPFFIFINDNNFEK